MTKLYGVSCCHPCHHYCCQLLLCQYKNICCDVANDIVKLQCQFLNMITKIRICFVINTTFKTFISCIVWSWCPLYTTLIEHSLSSWTILIETYPRYSLLTFRMMSILQLHFFLFIHSFFLDTKSSLLLQVLLFHGDCV